MTQERRDQPTPAGGDYSIAVYVTLATLAEVDQRVADGLVVSEYLADGTWLRETVMTYHHAAGAAPVATPEETFRLLGFEQDDSTETQVVFVGKSGLAAAKKIAER